MSSTTYKVRIGSSRSVAVFSTFSRSKAEQVRNQLQAQGHRVFLVTQRAH